MTPLTITTETVSEILRHHYGPRDDIATPLAPGAWSSAFAFETEDGPFVIRFSEHVDDFDRDSFAFRYRCEDLPIPAVTDRGIFRGLHYAVSERVTGGFLDDLSSPDLRQTLPSLARMFEALRSADVSTSTGYGLWDTSGNGSAASWPEHLRRSLEDSPETRGGSWREKLETSPTGAAAFDRDLEVLHRRSREMPNARHVVHSDLLNYNLFAREHRISGVIDWGCAMYGDFVYELAWFRFWWPWYPNWDGIDVVDAALPVLRDHGADLSQVQERLMCYQLHIGLGHQSYNASIGRWDALEAVTRHTTVIADEIR